MKRLVFGLFAVSVAIGLSAFTNIKPKSKFFTYYYVLSYNGLGYIYTYQQMDFPPESTNCLGTAPYSCYLGFRSNQGDSFPAYNIQGQIYVRSTSMGIYMPD